MFEPKVSLRPDLSADGGPHHAACSEATNESVCAFIGQSIGRATLHPLPGDNSCVEPPDSIPNSEVKRARADGSVHLACESRSSPGFLPKNPAANGCGVFLLRFPRLGGRPLVAGERPTPATGPAEARRR